MNKRAWTKIAVATAVIALSVYLISANFYVNAPDIGQLGGPIEGLTPQQLRLFYATRETFKHDFTPEEGLGPIFNGRSCFECHGQPGVPGGEGKDVVSTGVVRIANRLRGFVKGEKPLNEVITELTQDDVDRLFSSGGPAIGRKSITAEFVGKFPADCIIEAGTVPPRTELISLRHSPPLFGFGLIEAIPDKEISQNVFKEFDINKKLSGRLAGQPDPLTDRLHIGRFGWKAQFPNLILFTAEAMKVEHGVTTFIEPYEKFNSEVQQYPPCIRKYLPGEPNDLGFFQNKLAFHQALLAPPPRGPITPQVKHGEKVFNKLQCSVCHMPVMYTKPFVTVVDPNSPAPRLRWMEIKALENQPVRAYSDFLLHQMGVKLADGIPQNGAKGGEWRTTPLWGLRFKKFYLHDGRTRDLTEAILAHGGQAQEVTDNFTKLPPEAKEDLMAFLNSL